MDHVTISVACKDSRVRLSLESLTSYAYFFCVSFGICLHSPPGGWSQLSKLTQKKEVCRHKKEDFLTINGL